MTKDQYDTIDLSENELRRLDNFPRLRRLRSLLVSNNLLGRFDEALSERLPNLEMLVLAGNGPLDSVEALTPLRGLAKLRYLSLIDCPVSRTAHYRLRVVALLPQLRALDFRKISKAEREEARHFEGSVVTADAVLQKDEEPPRKLARVERTKIQDALKRAATLEEVEQLERILSTGHIPE